MERSEALDNPKFKNYFGIEDVTTPDKPPMLNQACGERKLLKSGAL
jgi:hypothetical protein